MRPDVWKRSENADDMAYDDLTGPRECEKSGEFKAGGVFFSWWGVFQKFRIIVHLRES